MIHINLLPFRAARKKENIRRQISIFLLTFIFTAVAMFYYNGVLSGQIGALDAEIHKTETDLARYRKIIQEIDRIKKDLRTLENMTKVITQLKVNQKWPITFLDTINDLVIEKRMWLTSLNAKGSSIDIKGIALDNKTVADFMTRLEKSAVFHAVNLKTVSQTKIKKYDLKNFHITCMKKTIKQSPKTTTGSKA